MDFQMYFPKGIWVGGDIFCDSKKNPKKPNTPEYAQVLVVTCPKLRCIAALVSSHPLNIG